MQARTWWVIEPVVMATSNPTDQDLAQLRAEGFSIVFSFLDEKEQPPRYDKKSATAAGWIVYSIPIEEGGVPSSEQLTEFIAAVNALPEGTKILMHCESGLGRTAFMVAAYWIANGLTADRAIGRVRQAAADADWITSQRVSALHEYARRRETAGTK